MELVNLIWLTHPTALNATIFAVQNESEPEGDNAQSELLTALLLDDTFNEYSESELQSAIAEAMTEY